MASPSGDKSVDRKRLFSGARQTIAESIRLNVYALVLDFVILTISSLLQGVSFLFLMSGGFLTFLLLLEAGILFLSGGAYVATSGIAFGKLRERIFHSEGWSPGSLRRSEASALPWIGAGALVLAESVLLSLM